MKKILLLALVFLVSCTSVVKNAYFGKEMEVYRVEYSGQEYFFYYPVSAIVDENSVVLDECKVVYEFEFKKATDPELLVDGGIEEALGVEVEWRRDAEQTYQSWYKEGRMVSYVATFDIDDPEGMEDMVFLFYVESEESAVLTCTDFVNELIDSFTDDLIYQNNRFDFSVNLPEGFKVEYLPGDEGIMVSKWFDGINRDGEEYSYQFEMAIFGAENFLDWKDETELISQKYAGYTIDFVDFESVSGVFVDEGGVDAKRHFFMIDEGDRYVYEAYMRTPSFHFTEHQEKFTDFVKSIKLL